jgi:hypothetical protein
MEKRESVFARSFAIVRKQFSTLWVAAVWPFIGVALCYIAIGIYLRFSEAQSRPNPLNLWQSMSGLGKLGILAAFVVSTALPQGLATAGVVNFVWKYLENGVATLGDAFSAVARNLLQLAILSLCIGAVVEFGSIFIVPGFAAMFFTAFAIPVLVIEHSGLMSAIKRSFALAAANVAGVVGLILTSIVLGTFLMIGALIVFLVLASVHLPWLGNMLAFWTCIILAESLTQMMVATMLAHLYIDARRRPEAAAPLITPA